MKTFFLLIISIMLFGCSPVKENARATGVFAVPEQEARWIREGEPIKYEEKLWYPQDRLDILLDSEVYYEGEYRGVPFFVEKVDIKPYSRILTKFGRNRFRVFRPKKDDSSY